LNTPLNQGLERLSGSLGLDGIYLIVAQFVAAGVVDMMSPLYHEAAAAAAAAPALAVPALPLPEAGLGGLAGGLTGSLGGGGGVAAGLGQAATVGGLSVPQSWATASPAIRLAATALPAAGLDGLPQAAAAGFGGPLGGMPMMGGVVNAPRNGAAAPRPESRHKVIPQMGAAPGVDEDTPDRGIKPNGSAADAVDALSERERYELHELRKELAELAMERDAVDRLIREAMQR
jgi:PPE-SVP subfamily C-terminal region